MNGAINFCRIWLACRILLMVGAIGSVHASETSFGIYIGSEQIENGSASTMGVFAESDKWVYMGLSLNKISSSVPIQLSGRKTILPLYFLVGARPPWKLAPYIEGGTDLVDKFFDNIGGANRDEENYRDDIDYYLSAGAKYSLSSRFELSLYAKKYVFKFREEIRSPQRRITPSGYGASLSLRF